jgi:hypothetical protein
MPVALFMGCDNICRHFQLSLVELDWLWLRTTVSKHLFRE